MKMKRFFAAAVAVSLSASLIACGSGNNTSDTAANQTNGTSQQTTTSAAAGQSEETTAGTCQYVDNEDPYTVVMGYIGLEKPDEVMIENAINEILEKELNAKLDLKCFSWGEFVQKIQLSLTGTDKLDIVPVMVNTAPGYVASGLVLDLKELIDTYGTNIKKYVDPDFINSPNINGYIYGVTPMDEQISWQGVIMRRDLLEEAGYTVNDETDMCEEITSLEDLTEVMAKVQEKHPEMTMMCSSAAGTPLVHWDAMDKLTDGFGVLMDYGQSTEVVNLYETEELKAFVQTMKEWNEAGYFSKDAITTTTSITEQVMTGKYFAYMTTMKAGAVTQDELSSKMDLAGAAIFGNPVLTSNSVNFLTWGIGRNCENPARTMKVLDYIYGSPEVMNLLCWGIEGTHYKFVDKEQGIIDYVDGQDGTTSGWMMGNGWQFPNQEIAYTAAPDTPAKWDYQHELIDTAVRSKALGFSYDSSSLVNELTALTNVKNQYFDMLGSGNVDDVDAVLKEFNDALYTAGLQKVIDEKQRQLDEWLATQGSTAE